MHDSNLNDNGKETERSWPTASRVLPDGMLVELLYDWKERTTSLAVWWDGTWARHQGLTLDTGERLIPFSRDNNLIRNDVVLLPSAPADYGSVPELLSDVRAYLRRYVDLSPLFESIATYYVLLSWIFDAFNEVPYLRLRGDFGTGKTRALIAIGSICYRPFFASGASSVSPIFHTLDAFRSTLVFDEADFRFSDEKAEVVKILNNGNVRGLPVLRTMQANNREWNPRAFQVFGPKLVATRGAYEDRALESRFLTEDMGQRPLRSGIPINLPDAQKAEALELRNKLLLYRFHHRHLARLDDSLVDPALEPRLNQILVPLLSVIDDPSLREDLSAVAASYQANLVAERALTVEGEVLEIVAELFAQPGDSSIPISKVTERFAERHGSEYARPVKPRWIGNIVRQRLHLATYKSHGVYVIPRVEASKVDALCARHGIDALSERLTGDAIAA